MKLLYLKYINAYKSSFILFLNQNHYEIMISDYLNNLSLIIFYLL